MRLRALCQFLAATLFLLPVSAFAGTIVSYSLSDVVFDNQIFDSSGFEPATGTLSISGSYLIDSSANQFISGDVFVNRNGTIDELNQIYGNSAETPGKNPASIILVDYSTGLLFGLAIPSIADPANPICSLSYSSGECSNDPVLYGGRYTSVFGDGSMQLGLGDAPVYEQIVASGRLVPTTLAATPEPSGLLLLGTGLVGVAGAARKRFAS